MLENLLKAPIELDDAEIEAVSGGAFNGAITGLIATANGTATATGGAAGGNATASGTGSVARVRAGSALAAAGVVVIV